MATGDGSDLIDRVGYKTIGAVLTTSTMPTVAMAAQWLNDGAYELMRRVNPVLIPEVVKAPAALSFSSGIANLPADFFKVVALYDANGQYRYVDPKTFAVIETDTNSYYGKTSLTYTLMDDDVYVGTTLTPSTPKLIYIRTLTAAIADDANVCELSVEIRPMIVDYAVIQSKQREEEYQQYMGYMDWWYKRIESMNKSVPIEEITL